MTASQSLVFEGSSGLTKREYFASVAMQGILAQDTGNDYGTEDVVRWAVNHADKLIEELNKTKESN